jgi:hypothetical protein
MAGLDRCGKSRPPPAFDLRTVQPVGSRYTDYATRPTTISEWPWQIEEFERLPGAYQAAYSKHNVVLSWAYSGQSEKLNARLPSTAEVKN